MIKKHTETAQNIVAAAIPPSDCSDAIHISPARGRIDTYQGISYEGLGTANPEDIKEILEPYRAGKPGMVRDVFDTMTEQAKKRGKPGTFLFTKHQVGIARDYRALQEWVEASGIKCTSAFDAGAGGDGSGKIDFMDAYLIKSQKLSAMRNAIGTSIAKQSKIAVKPSSGERKVITDRALVDAVCLHGADVSYVLNKYQWSITGRNRSDLMRALCSSLDRMCLASL